MTSVALEDELGSDEEELRFFSQPPPAYDDGDAFTIASARSPNAPMRHDAASADSEAEAALFRERRAVLRQRVVATVAAALSLLLLGVVVHRRAEAERYRALAAPVPVVAPRAIGQTPSNEPAASPSSTLAAAEPAPSNVPAQQSAATPVEVVVPDVEVAPLVDVATPPAEATPAAADAAKLLKKARNLLNAGKSREGVATARDALQADSSDAAVYMLLGAGLQDLGQFAEARAVFADCARLAKRGPVASCRYFSKR